MNVPSEDKATLRARLRELLRALPESARLAASQGIRGRIQCQPFWPAARTILGFVATRHEPDLGPLLAEALVAGKRLCLPQYEPAREAYRIAEVRDLSRDLHRGQFGILEPVPGCPRVPLNQLDLALIPGLGFTPIGARIGRGKGYFDRLLAEVSGIKCGIAFDVQLLPTIHLEPHDVRVDAVITELRCLSTVHDRNE